MMTLVQDRPVGRPKKPAQPKTTPIRLTEDAVAVARIASGFTGESVAEYASRILLKYGNLDIDQFTNDRIKLKKGAKG